MIKRFVGRLAVIVTVASSVLVTTQATAMADFSWCPNGKLCFSTGENGNGTKWSYWVSAMAGGVEMSSNQRSQVSSVWNRTNGPAIFWDTLECRVSSLPELEWHPGAGNMYGIWDNRARSFGHSENRPSFLTQRCAHLNG